MDNYKDELTEVQRRAVEKLQAELQATTEADVNCHGGPRKAELELPPEKRYVREREALENPHWTKVRLLAREALAAFNRERRDPVPAREIKPNMWEGP